MKILIQCFRHIRFHFNSVFCVFFFDKLSLCADLLDFSGTDELTIRAADPGAEFAALLLIPAENREEIFPILRYFICLNNLPERFPEGEGSLP